MKFFKKYGKLSLRSKVILSLGAIAVVLLVSSLISVLEYRSMSSYVSDMVADNIQRVNVARKLADVSNEYNLAILAVVGDESSVALPDFDAKVFMAHCDSLRKGLSSNILQPLADSVEYAYSAYMLTSMELEDVISSDFIDTRSWYFERLQPRYRRLRQDIDNLSNAIYSELEYNSGNFENSYYRSIVPGFVAVAVGLVLILLLVFFLNVYLVDPVYKMRDSIELFRTVNSRYGCTFPGDDELQDLNRHISEIAEDNQQLRRRISALRNKNNGQ